MVDDITPIYPAQYETEVLLKDGSRILLRPIKKEDTELWLTFFRRLSQQHTRYLRLHHMTEKVDPEDALRFCTVDYNNTFAFVAEVLKKHGKDIVAIGRYYRLPGKHSAIVTLAVEDAYRGKGIGTHLLEWLAKVARDNGITVFEADAFAENEQIMTVLRDYGFRFISEQKAGMYHITIPLTQSQRITVKEEERERLSTLTSIRHILSPRSIAVIGASRQPGSIGQIILKAIVENGFTGVVYPVNPKADQVMSIKAYPSILDVPGEVDMGVIVVPTHLVARVAKDCGLKGVHALVVISDGFKERGPEGAIKEEELRDITLGHGMRLVGPNCMGVINTSPAVKMNASFSPAYPSAGNVAFLSQSGAMGVVILEYASSLNMGISSFVSVGNRADISSNDLLSYWEQDPATKVILLYLESFGNPRQFSRIAQRVAAKKPIIVVKSGTTPAGSRAASSHTGSLATSDVVSDALFHQAGIIRVDSMQELFDVASLLSNQPLPKGRRLAILTNGGGPGIIAADASIQHGLQLPEFGPKTKEELSKIVKRDISLNNPLDLTGSFTREEFEGAMKVMAQDNDIDAVLALFVPAVASNVEAVENSIRKIIPLYRQRKKPLLVCFMGQRSLKAKPGATEKFVSFFTFPENAVSALAKAAEYRELIQKPKGTIPRIHGIKRIKAHKIIDKALSRTAQRPLWLSPQEIAELLNCYGMYAVETGVARTASKAAALAAKIGFPVVVKLDSPTISHKTEVGGVILDLRTEGEVIKAFNTIKSRLAKIGREDEMAGVTIQRMVKTGVEAIVGVTQDPVFGPLIMFGLGGIHAELLKDVALRLHPLTELDARELVSSIKMAKLFEGFRGSSPSDKEALQDLLLRLSAMVEDIPQIAELDFNPVKVMSQGKGYRILDARISIS